MAVPNVALLGANHSLTHQLRRLQFNQLPLAIQFEIGFGVSH